jgi:hypothetical protein
MKFNSETTDRKARKLLVLAQLMSLAFFALGLAFVLCPTPVTLFLFTTLSLVLAPGAGVILATQWIASYQRRQTHPVTAQSARPAYTGSDPMPMAG